MANRATITYNGITISTEDRDGNFPVTYNGSTIATIEPGQTKTLNCNGQLMKTNVVVGGKTLNCAKYKMASNVVIAVTSLFPSTAPTSYNLIDTYTSSQTWTAPENGYYKIEVFGASGNGGTGALLGYVVTTLSARASGGGGGGGGYSCSQGVTLNKGDKIILTIGGVGSTTSAAITSSHNSSYTHTLQVTSGANGGDGTGTSYKNMTKGSGGSGGTASGGKTSNYNGGNGADGTNTSSYTSGTSAGGAGGAGGTTGCNVGGAGATVTTAEIGAFGTGAAGFIKIYRGNTNSTSGDSGGSSSSGGYIGKYTGDLIDCTIEVYDSTGAKKDSNAKIYANDYILIDPGYTVSSLSNFSVTATPSANATWTTSLYNGKIKMTFTSISGSITISAYL